MTKGNVTITLSPGVVGGTRTVPDLATSTGTLAASGESWFSVRPRRVTT